MLKMFGDLGSSQSLTKKRIGFNNSPIKLIMYTEKVAEEERMNRNTSSFHNQYNREAKTNIFRFNFYFHQIFYIFQYLNILLFSIYLS